MQLLAHFFMTREGVWASVIHDLKCRKPVDLRYGISHAVQQLQLLHFTPIFSSPVSEPVLVPLMVLIGFWLEVESESYMLTELSVVIRQWRVWRLTGFRTRCRRMKKEMFFVSLFCLDFSKEK